MNDRRRLSKIIEAARDKKGWTREQFAEKLNKDYMTVYRQETNRKPFGDETLQKACQLLGLDFRDMLQLKKPMLKVKEGEAPSYSSEIERAAKNVLDIAQKRGMIPEKLPEGIVSLIITEVCRHDKKSSTLEDVRKAYQTLKESDPRLNEQCEIWELMLGPAISQHDLAEIKVLLTLKADRGDKAKNRK